MTLSVTKSSVGFFFPFSVCYVLLQVSLSSCSLELPELVLIGTVTVLMLLVVTFLGGLTKSGCLLASSAGRLIFTSGLRMFSTSLVLLEVGESTTQELEALSTK